MKSNRRRKDSGRTGLRIAAWLCLALACAAVPFWVAWRNRVEDWARDQYWEGTWLRHQGRYAEAAEHLHAYLSVRGDDSDAIAELGYTLHRAGRSAEGEALIDRALALRPRPHYAAYKALTIAARADVDAALAWLAHAALSDLDRCDAVATFHRARGEHAEAIAPLRAWLALQPGQALLVGGTLQVPSQVDTSVQGQLASLVRPLECLALSELWAGDIESADDHAALGIAVGQLLDRDKSHLGDEIMTGSVECRIVRARVAIDRGSCEVAAEHLRLARAGRGPATWAEQQRLAEVESAFAARRQR